MSTKTAIIVLSDPANGEEAMGRVFNALGAAHDLRQAKHDVEIVFQGTGVRWPAKLRNPEHPVHGLYEQVKDLVAGASAGCATAFGALDDVQACGLPLLKDNALPGTPGLSGFAKYVAGGYHVLTF